MEQITTVGIDLAKNIFQVHAIDAAGRVVLQKAFRRPELSAPPQQRGQWLALQAGLMPTANRPIVAP